MTCDLIRDGDTGAWWSVPFKVCMKSKYPWDLEYTLWQASDWAKASLWVFLRCVWFNSHYTREKDVTFVSYSCSVAKYCLTLWDPMDCSMPGFPVLHYLLEFTQNSCPLSQWCHLTISSSVTPFSSCPQSFPASGFFPCESALCIRWPKYWSLRFSLSPSNEYSELYKRKLAKEKKGLFLGQDIFFAGKGNGKCFIMQIASSSSRGWRGSTWLITLVVLDQKISAWSIKITFLREIETAIRSVIKSRFGVLGSRVMPFWAVVFFSMPRRKTVKLNVFTCSCDYNFLFFTDSLSWM